MLGAAQARAQNDFISIDIMANKKLHHTQCSAEYETCFLTLHLDQETQVQTIMWFWHDHVIMLFQYKGQYLTIQSEDKQHVVLRISEKEVSQKVTLLQRAIDEDQPWNRMPKTERTDYKAMVELNIRINSGR